MITLICEHAPKPLGDQIDAIFLAHMISKVEGDTVNVCYKSKDINFLNSFVEFGDVVTNQPHSSHIMTFHNTKRHGIQLYYNYSSKFETIPLKSNIETRAIDLPKKFVTAQWDAKQIYRTVDKYDKDRIPRIEKHYTDAGYEVIRVGGEGKYKRLEEIIYVMSKASLHIGAGSGMMHIAKFLMPTENLHYYCNITKRDDFRFPDGWDVAWMGRELLRRGARLNYCETPPQDQIDYFRSLSPWV